MRKPVIGQNEQPEQLLLRSTVHSDEDGARFTLPYQIVLKLFQVEKTESKRDKVITFIDH